MDPWTIFLSALLVLFCSKTQLCSASDTISAGQSLIANQTMVSRGGNFELGFFSPGNSLKYYIGIWYKKVSVQTRTVVWVANRDNPLTDLSSSELKLLDNGNLVLLNQSKIPVWSTDSTSNTLNSSEAVLGDDGNLVLQGGLNRSFIIWQSFDHPTDTWLPGGKLRYDNISKKSQKLISWKNLEDPAPGIFSLELEPDNEYVIQWNGSQKYWKSGVWDGHIFSLIPQMGTNYIYNFSYISNENESYFTYTAYDKSLVSRFVMDLSGLGKQFLWSEDDKGWNLFWSQPGQQCEVYALCGAFGSCNEISLPFCKCLQGFKERSMKDWNLRDSSGGCVRKTTLQCGDKDRFSPIPNMKLPKDSVSLAVESADKCRLACLSNCSCNAYAYISSGCSILYGDLLSLRQLDDGGDDLYVRVASSELSSSKKGSTTPWVIVGIVAGNVALLGIVLVLIWRWQMRRSVGTSKTVEGSMVPFTYRELQIVTKKFSEKLGGGGFGSVFKGTLPDKTVIAVKKLEGISQGEKQFRTEISTIGLIQHVNLVRLHGFCSESTKRMLVYDFMPNGSLDKHLFHQNNSQILNWNMRYRIAVGIARGLAYLHEECRDCIIHCDIKPENILLDADFSPKVADFGLAKLLGRDFSRVLTTTRGTIGYLAPEWSSGVPITRKADVYSYGMMLFEIISGKRNLKQSEDGKAWFFPTWATSRVSEGHEVLSILDKKLEGKADIEELTRAFRVAGWCIQEDEVHRPSMGQAVQILEGLLEVKPPPMPKYLQILVENEENINFFSDCSKHRVLQT